jgi:hypothetical protein
MRGYKDFNYPAFNLAAKELRNLGHEVFSPAERDTKIYGDDSLATPTGDLADVPHFDLREALGADLAWITAHAEGVVVLPDWERSKGAQAEVATAEALSLPILTIDEALDTPMSPRASALAEATQLITGDRNNAYGPPTQDFTRTAMMATGFGFQVNGQPLQGHHVAIFMILLKMSRLAWTPGKRDSWVDTAGYAGCGYECAVEGAQTGETPATD